MSKINKQSIRWTVALGTFLSLGGLGYAQDDSSDDEEIFELSPFEVTAGDTSGYRATSTLAGTRIRTDLKDVGSAISVYTEDFLKDIDATDNSTLLQYTTNAEAGGTQGVYLGSGNGASLDESSALVAPQSNNRIRGLASADNTRDYAPTDIPTDYYVVDRVDVLRGANSLLFGLGSPAGIVNSSMKGAAFDNRGGFDIRFDTYGGIRLSTNLNKVILEDELAIRIGLLKDDKEYRQKPAHEDNKRLYLAARYEPKFLSTDSAKTSLSFKYEDGSVRANRPRNVTPVDGVSQWFNPIEVDPQSNPYGGLGRTLVDNPFVAAATVSNRSSEEYSPWVGGAVNQQQPFWMVDGITGEISNARAGIINNGARNADGTKRGAAEGVIGRRNTQPFLSTRLLNQAVNDITDANGKKLPAWDSGLYKNQSITDPGIFDFYNNLIDGNTKYENADFDVANIELNQSFLNNKLAFNVVYDKQDYGRENGSLLGWQPTIRVDIMENWDDLQPNQNVGRTYVTSSMNGSGSSYATDREYKRASVFAELSAYDFMDSDNILTKLLGTHRINATTSENRVESESKGWWNTAADLDWAAYWTASDGLNYKINDRGPVSVIYLGGSVVGANSASELNIPAVSYNGPFIRGNSVKVFDSTWVGPSYADNPDYFTQEWTVPASIQPAYTDESALTQISNPDNYLGWIDKELGLVNYQGLDNDPLLSRRSTAYDEVSSSALSLQSYFWDGALVTTLGWREDEITSGATTYQPDTNNRYAVTIPAVSDPRTQSDTSSSRGAVLHLNKLFGANDPLPINVSLAYNEGSNFQPTSVRRDVFGTEIANPSGETEDFSLSFSTKDNKYTFRALKYESRVKGASTSLSANDLGSTVANGLNWRNVFLYKLGAYSWNTREQDSYRNRASNAFPVNGTNPDQPYRVERGSAEELAVEDAMITGWNNIQGWLTDKGFMDAWKINAVPMQYLTDRSTYAASLNEPLKGENSFPSSQYLPPEGSISSYSFSMPDNFAVTADVLSEGYEFEFIANPTDNWRLSFNASKTEASYSNVGGDSLNELIEYLDDALLGTAAADIPRWGGWGNRVGLVYSNWRSNYVLMKLQEGTSVPELRKWRYNVVTNYKFNDGRFKGLSLGASYRWVDKVAIAYPLIGDSPAEYSYDLNNPIYESAKGLLDLSASYGRKLNDKIDWNVKLSIRNVGEGDELIPVTYNPNGDIAGVKIGPTQEWYLSNGFSF